jgi:acetoin utilization protein AcuC
MACTLHVAWDGRLAAYDFGAGHPMAPARVELTIELARAFGLFVAAGVSVESPVSATDAELELVHDPRDIAGVRLAGRPEPDPSVLDFGLGTEEDPVFPGMHDASALVAGPHLVPAPWPSSWRPPAGRRAHVRGAGDGVYRHIDAANLDLKGFTGEPLMAARELLAELLTGDTAQEQVT